MSSIIDLEGTPYSIEPAAAIAIAAAIQEISDRIELLRSEGKLTQETLQEYYGQRRFEQIAESNALEGSTLSVGETELAVLKGITITGHDPAYTRDAISLNRALERLTDLAQIKRPTNLEQLRELHGLILGDHPSAGQFRKDRVSIRGANHVPPKTWEQVMANMEDWERWSLSHPDDPAIVRATILHAWLTHIHPFRDGNGRAARAITNLELVRAGYPPIIIRKKERSRYLDALAQSDDAGNLSPLFDLFSSRAWDSLKGLELAARLSQGYDPVVAQIRHAQEQRLQIWNTSVELLYKITAHELDTKLQSVGGESVGYLYSDSLDLEDYLDLCAGRSVSRSWCFKIRCSVPGIGSIERLAWAGYRTPSIKAVISEDSGGPSIFWSKPNPSLYPPWIQAGNLSPGGEELTTIQGQGDTWFIRFSDNKIDRLSTSDLAIKIANDFIGLLLPSLGEKTQSTLADNDFPG